MANRKRTDWAVHENRRLIRERALEIGDGYRAKNSEFGEDGLPFARAGNVNGDFNFVDADILDSKSVAKAKEKVSRSEDSVITTKGTFGRVAFVRGDTPKFVYSPQLCYWRVLDPATIEPRFLYYWLQGPEFYSQAFQIKSSTDMADYASLRDQRDMRITLPTPATQRKIAAILSAYDELIENNKRRIALLEKMAEEIYREWFVRLRFPGHEKVKFRKGLPEGWKLSPFSDLVTINPLERIDKAEEVPFVAMEDLALDSMYFTSTQSRKGGQGSKFRNDDVLFPRITPSVENGKRGFVMILQEGQVALGSTEFIVFRQKTLTPEHIFFVTCSGEFRKNAELSMTGASGRQRVQENCFSFFLVKVPPVDIRNRFSNVVRPFFSQVRLLSQQNENLQKTRDLLLPRLISGKLSVENLEVQFPPGMMEEYETPPESPLHKKGGSGGSEAED